MIRSDPPADPIVAACRSCGAEIEYLEVKDYTPAVCSNCGGPVEIVTVIEDSTDRGFDPTAYYDA